MSTLLRRREVAVWGVCLLAVWALLVATGFVSRDPDSAFYAVMTERLANGPASAWIAPEWGGLWNGTGLWQEHPIGIYLVPIAFAKLGFPAGQAAYAMGIAAALGCLVLMARLAAATHVEGAGRAALVLLQLVPAAFVFRVRANHEYPMLLCLLAALVALDGVRRSWVWLPAVAAAITAALLIKGVFVAIVLLGAGLWALLNPLRAPGSMIRPLVALAVAVGCAAAMAVGYDVLYERAAGTTFWAGYWRRQLGPVAEAAPGAGLLPILGHIAFYAAHLAWLSAPWGAALVGLTIVWCGWARDRWQRMPAPLRGRFDPDAESLGTLRRTLSFLAVLRQRRRRRGRCLLRLARAGGGRRAPRPPHPGAARAVVAGPDGGPPRIRPAAAAPALLVSASDLVWLPAAQRAATTLR